MNISKISRSKVNTDEYKKQSIVRRLKTSSGGFEHIVFATDQDLDGIHIRGLLSGFIERYLSSMSDRVGMLQTPVIAITKNGKVQRWTYSLDGDIKVNKGEAVDYKKGLGSWDPEELKYIIEQEGLDAMISQVDFDTIDIMDEWLGDDSAPRKKYIVANHFNIAQA